MRPESLELLKALTRAASPSGYEGAAGTVYREYAQAFADLVNTDMTGNIAAVLNPDAPTRIMLAAHMDEIGFVIHFIGEDGLLHFGGIGGHDDVTPVGQRVWVHGKERIPGVVGTAAFHLLDPAEQSKRPQIKNLWIDIGASSRAEAAALVQLGDPVTFQQELHPLMADRVAARAFDNKAGVFIIAEALRLLREGGGIDGNIGVHAVATVQEEIGSRGVQTATFAIKPVTGLTVDMEHAVDYPGIDQRQHGKLEIGKGPTVCRGPNVNHVVFDLLIEAARAEDIPYQVSVYSTATPTDAGAMQIARSGVATGLVGVPIRYMHTPSEVLSLTDLESCARLVAAYCRRIRPQTQFQPRY
jgi:endoglucanase